MKWILGNKRFNFRKRLKIFRERSQNWKITVPHSWHLKLISTFMSTTPNLMPWLMRKLRSIPMKIFLVNLLINKILFRTYYNLTILETYKILIKYVILNFTNRPRNDRICLIGRYNIKFKTIWWFVVFDS